MKMTEQPFTSIDSALSALFGSSAKIVKRERISGGDINDAYGLTLTDGSLVFMKTNAKERLAFFTAEAEGLRAISATGAVGTPRILGCGTDGGNGGCSFLLLEFIWGGRRMPDYWEMLGNQLAAMHRARTDGFTRGGKYGFTGDNYIGARAQVNTPYESWTAFFRDCRLEVQFQHASRYFDGADMRRITRLLDRVENILVEPEYPSLLHGDLWGGNVIAGNDGRAWLIDPAVYVGHAEADIAMTELFGGFPAAFYGAYREAGGWQPGYEHRRDIYHLYHLLNHLNMFGGGYLSSVKRIVEKYA